MRQRTFDVVGAAIPLPENRKQYSASEACAILLKIEEEKENTKGLSLNKVVNAMTSYKVSSTSQITPLIPCGRSAMFRLFDKFKSNRNVEWAVRGKCWNNEYLTVKWE